MTKLLTLVALVGTIACAAAQLQFGSPFAQRGIFDSGAYNPNYNNGAYYQGAAAFGRIPLPAAVRPIARPAFVAPIAAATAFVGTTDEGQARIISQSNDATPDGAYQYQYETENGIQAQEINQPRVINNGAEAVVVNTVQGSYSYTAPTGEQIAVSYLADENGFQPTLHGAVGPLAASVSGAAGPAAIRKN